MNCDFENFVFCNAGMGGLQPPYQVVSSHARFDAVLWIGKPTSRHEDVVCNRKNKIVRKSAFWIGEFESRIFLSKHVGFESRELIGCSHVLLNLVTLTMPTTCFWMVRYTDPFPRLGICGTHLKSSIQEIVDEVAPIKKAPVWGWGPIHSNVTSLD